MRKTALITGGTRGIGFGIAQQLASAGIDLILNGTRTETLIKDELNKLKEKGAQVSYIKGDISSAQDRLHIIHQIKKEYGQLNYLVNNAGIAPKTRKDLLQITEEEFDEVMNVNLKGTYFLTQLTAQWMIEQSMQIDSFNACIINISSISADLASVNRSAYCISKSGISMLTKLLAIRMSEYSIPVYEIRPGIIETDMTAKVKEKYISLIQSGLTLEPRMGQPEDIGKIVKALVQGDLPYSTGQVLTPDGGLTIDRL